MSQQLIFYTGGALPLHYLYYISRQADQKAIHLLNRRKSIYLKGAKQTGKSSFFKRFAGYLRNEGWICCSIDLATLKNLKPSKWFQVLAEMIAKECEINPIQSSLKNQIDFRSFLLDEIGIRSSPIKLALLFDEVESLLNLNFSDAFLMTLRDIYQQRYSYSGQLHIALTGSINSSRLIKDTDISPYNIAEEIKLKDFTKIECSKLTSNLKHIGVPMCESTHDYIHEWTAGHPYLTQRICEVIEDWWRKKIIRNISPDVIIKVIQENIKQDLHVEYVVDKVNNLKSKPKKLWRRIRAGEIVYSNELGSSVLYLTGAFIETSEYQIKIRNRIYEEALIPKIPSPKPKDKNRVQKPRIKDTVITSKEQELLNILYQAYRQELDGWLRSEDIWEQLEITQEQLSDLIINLKEKGFIEANALGQRALLRITSSGIKIAR